MDADIHPQLNANETVLSTREELASWQESKNVTAVCDGVMAAMQASAKIVGNGFGTVFVPALDKEPFVALLKALSTRASIHARIHLDELLASCNRPYVPAAIRGQVISGSGVMKLAACVLCGGRIHRFNCGGNDIVFGETQSDRFMDPLKMRYNHQVHATCMAFLLHCGETSCFHDVQASIWPITGKCVRSLRKRSRTAEV